MTKTQTTPRLHEFVTLGGNGTPFANAIPLLAEEGAKRKPDRAKPKEKRAEKRRRRGGADRCNVLAELTTPALRATRPLRGGE